MAVTFDAVGVGIPSSTGYGTTPQSCLLTPSLTTPLLILAGVAWLHNAANTTLAAAQLAMTYGGVPMTEIGREGNNAGSSPSGGVALFWLLNPGVTGAQSLAVTCNANSTPTAMDSWWANAVSYLGASGIGTPVMHGGTGSPSTGAVTSAVGHIVASILGSKTTAVSSPSGTSRYFQSGTTGFESGYLQDAPGAASVTETISTSTSTYAGVAVDILAATVSPGKNRNISRQAVNQAALY